MKTFVLDQENILYLINLSILITQHSKLQLLNSLQWPIYIINSVNNSKLHCYTLPLLQHLSFLRNLPPLPAQQSSTQHELAEKKIPLC